jgi:hypothetical protein
MVLLLVDKRELLSADVKVYLKECKSVSMMAEVMVASMANESVEMKVALLGHLKVV